MTYWKWAAGAAVVVLLSAGAAFLLGRSTIEVMVDLRSDAPGPRLVRLDQGSQVPLDATFERLPPELSPPQESFEITSTGTKNSAARNSEVWILDFPFLDEVIQDPAGSWERRDDRMVSYKVQPAKLRWSGVGAKKFSLVKHLDSGIARVRTGDGEKELDLYAPEWTTIAVPLVANEHLARYRARIPRSALRDLALVTRDVPVRVSLGTFQPLVLVKADQAEPRETGRVVERWAPAFHDGAVLLGPTQRIEHGGSPTFLALLLALTIVSGVVRAFYLTLRGPGSERPPA
ncbi:MAG: hypothetical protein QM765_02990 [Myxococcales bacterium]